MCVRVLQLRIEPNAGRPGGRERVNLHVLCERVRASTRACACMGGGVRVARTLSPSAVYASAAAAGAALYL